MRGFGDQDEVCGRLTLIKVAAAVLQYFAKPLISALVREARKIFCGVALSGGNRVDSENGVTGVGGSLKK